MGSPALHGSETCDTLEGRLGTAIRSPRSAHGAWLAAPERISARAFSGWRWMAAVLRTSYCGLVNSSPLSGRGALLDGHGLDARYQPWASSAKAFSPTASIERTPNSLAQSE